MTSDESLPNGDNGETLRHRRSGQDRPGFGSLVGTWWIFVAASLLVAKLASYYLYKRGKATASYKANATEMSFHP
jgi:hypothetical protein